MKHCWQVGRPWIWALVASGMLLGAGCVSVRKPAPGVAVGPGESVPARQGQAYAHYMAGVMHESRGEPAKASRELEAAFGLDAASPTPLLRLLRSYLREEKYEQALRMVLEAHERIPNQASLYIVEGKIRQHLKQYAEAVRALQQAIEISPDNPLGYSALVDMQESSNDLVGAAEIYERLLGLNPDSAALQFRLGLNLLRMNDVPGARRHLDKALELDPKMDRARFFLGVAAFDSKEFATAVLQFLAYLQQRPEDNDAIEYVAASFARLEQYADAASWFAKLAGGSEFQPADYLAVMYIVTRAGQPERADAMAPPSGAPMLAVWFTAAARAARGEPARPLLESLDAIEADFDEEVTGVLSRLMYLLGPDTAGAWMLEQTAHFEREVQSKTLSLLRARLLMLLERHEEAAAVLDGMLTTFGSAYLPHYFLAQCHEKLANFEQTEAHLRACLEINPDNPELLNFLGYLYADNNVKLDEAKQLIEKALAIEPENAYYQDSMGWVHYRKGQADKAVEFIQRAIYGMENDDAILRDHLGDAFLLLGNLERALVEWKKALRLDPKLKGVQEKIQAHEGRLQQPAQPESGK